MPVSTKCALAWHGTTLPMRESSRLEIVQPTVRRSSQHDRSMRAHGAMPTLPVGIDEWHLARAMVDEEIERIDRVDLDRELDQHVELGDRLPGLERDARDAIAVRIAQPVQAMLRLDQQLIALDPRARVIGRNRTSCGPGSAGLG